MGSLPQQAMELEVEQPATGRPKNVEAPAEVDGGSTTKTKGGHVASLMEEYRPASTWAEHPQ
jgi:hypothetical protein